MVLSLKKSINLFDLQKMLPRWLKGADSVVSHWLRCIISRTCLRSGNIWQSDLQASSHAYKIFSRSRRGQLYIILTGILSNLIARWVLESLIQNSAHIPEINELYFDNIFTYNSIFIVPQSTFWISSKNFKANIYKLPQRLAWNN